jgi:hypothetical protein
MSSILIVLAAVLLLINSLFGAATGLFSISGMLMLVLPSFGFVYVLFTFYRVCQAAR